MGQLNTVAIILEGQRPLIVPYATAMDEYRRLADVTLIHEQDLKLFQALTVALGVLPKPTLPKLDDGRTRADFITATWRETFKELNQS
jgi:hypothetical protein